MGYDKAKVEIRGQGRVEVRTKGLSSKFRGQGQHKLFGSMLKPRLETEVTMMVEVVNVKGHG